MTQKQSFWFSSNGLAALTLIGAVSYFLFMEHREHLFQFLPFLILLLCPLMHIFMHSGHSHGGQGEHGKNNDRNRDNDLGYQKGYEDGLRDHKEQEKNQ
jgi:Protein of unknown function (DUF2933)